MLRHFYQMSRRVQACHVLDYGLRSADAWSLTRELTIGLSPYVERSGAWDQWNQTLVNAIAAAQQAGDVDGEITLRALFARLLQRQGHASETIQQYRNVIRMARASDNRFEEARACSNLGYLFIDGGRFWRSEVLCRDALAIFGELQSKHGLAHTHNHLGLLYTRQRSYESAEKHLKLACSVWQSLHDHHSLFLGYMNLGILYFNTRNRDEALNHLYMALHEAQITGEQVETGKIWAHIGHLHLEYKMYAEAKEYLEQAQQIFANSNQRLELARIWNNLGLAHLGCQNPMQAKAHFEQAQQVFARFNHRLELANTQHNLGLTHQYLNEWNAATSLLELAQRVFEVSGRKHEEIKVLVALISQRTLSNSGRMSINYDIRLKMLLEQCEDNVLQEVYDSYRQEYWDSLLIQRKTQQAIPVDD